MNERDFDEITRFLTMVGKASLFEYLSLSTTASEGEVDRAIKERRTWAQGQQANPKYRGEALWVIKNQRAMREAMVEHRLEYLGNLQSRDQEKNLEVLALFIRGTLASGRLTRTGEQAILAQAQKLGIPEGAARARIQAVAAEQGAGASAEDADDFIDHYATLGLNRDASAEEIEQAYRARYRWARTLADTHRSREEFGRLDAALRDLKDPSRRAAYDEVHRQRVLQAADSLGGAQGLLPPPPEPGPLPEAGAFDDPPSQPSVRSAAPGSPRASQPSEAPGPRLSPPRKDPFELSEPPGTPPPIRAETVPTRSAPPLTPLPEPPPVARPRGATSGGTSDRQRRTAPPGQPAPLAEPATETSGEVPRPGQVTARTLDLNQQQEGTRLELKSPAVMAIKTGSRGTTARILLKQVGPGTVTGRVLADRDWVTVEPARLDTTRREHTLQVRIHADRLQRSRASSLVTIVPSHGPRVTVTLDVEKRSPALMVGLLVLLLLLGVGAAARLLLGQAPAPSEPRVLLVRPNPSSAMVFVEDRLIGPGEQRVDLQDYPKGPLELKVELGGFGTYTESVVVNPGQVIERSPRLELTQSLNALPGNSEQGRPLESSQVNEQVRIHQALFDECFALPNAPGPSQKLKAYVSFSGQVEGMSPVEPKEPDPAFFGCLARGMRAMQFVLKDPADYYFFETTLRAGGGR